MPKIDTNGLAAFRSREWRTAFELLSAAATERTLGSEELEALGESAWWLGRRVESNAAYEGAYKSHLDAGRKTQAAWVALGLSRTAFGQLDHAVAAGWWARASSLLEGEPECGTHGWLAAATGIFALFAGDFEGALPHLAAAREVAGRFADRDLDSLCMIYQSLAFIKLGQTVAGTALMDEAMIAAVAGEVGPFVGAEIYCATMHACIDTADFRRAVEWTQACERAIATNTLSCYPDCRVHRASVIRVLGDWDAAERQAAEVCDAPSTMYKQHIGMGMNEIGQIKFLRGDLAGAEAAFRRAHELGESPEPGLSLVRLAQGRLDVAAASIARALAQTHAQPEQIRLLSAQVEIALAAEDAPRAAAAAEELETLAATIGTPGIHALALGARGSVRLSNGDAIGAIEAFGEERQIWRTIGAPYEEASARMRLGAAYAATGDRETSELELKAALAAFENLAAMRDARRAAEALGRSSGRRAVRTFMFTDIERSTNLLEAIGDSAWENILDWHDAALRSTFKKYNGQEFDHAGDGFFVAFENADMALDCAIAIERALEDHRRTQGYAPQVRIGVHTAEATDVGGDFRGMGVHEAARVGAAAAGGEILASSQVLELVGGHFKVTGKRTVPLKGLPEPVTLATIDWR